MERVVRSYNRMVIRMLKADCNRRRDCIIMLVKIAKEVLQF